jgi:hypothetical protein
MVISQKARAAAQHIVAAATAPALPYFISHKGTKKGQSDLQSSKSIE